uniref:Uncharacterized protein n=1 Tax=Anguilla anguilla TaxID=7936 RepID=A0A0E9U923_ANGAN
MLLVCRWYNSSDILTILCICFICVYYIQYMYILVLHVIDLQQLPVLVTISDINYTG